MRSFPDVRFRELLHRITEARDGLEKVGPEKTLDRVVTLKHRCAALGVRSPHLWWMEAFVLELLGRTEEAYRAIVEAARLDPLDPEIQKRLAGLAWALRHALADESRSPVDPSTPRLYALLQETGESDVPCHLAMASHLAETGRAGEALRLVEAVLLVAPASRDAWLARGRLARAAGDEATVARCEAALAGISAMRPPFDVDAPREVAVAKAAAGAAQEVR